MFQKSYTAIISNSSETRAVNVSVCPGDEKNEKLVLEKYPEYALLALVPGQHADWSHVYHLNATSIAQRNISSVKKSTGTSNSVDVWDMSEHIRN
jgi:hypothetical protein